MEAYEIEECISRFGTDVYRFCLKLCLNREDAEDLYQQTFLKGLESQWKLDWEQNPRALFFSLANHLWKSSQRKYARRASIAPCSSMDEDDGREISSEENVESDFFKKELQSEVNKAIEALPDKIRIPMTLYYMFELSVEQVAETIKARPGTVKSRLYKGRSMIKKRLEELGYGE